MPISSMYAWTIVRACGAVKLFCYVRRMETVAFLFHDETGQEIGKFKLKAGDDAKSLKWIDISSQLVLYASHRDFIKKVAEMKGAHW